MSYAVSAGVGVTDLGGQNISRIQDIRMASLSCGNVHDALSVLIERKIVNRYRIREVWVCRSSVGESCWQSWNLRCYLWARISPDSVCVVQENNNALVCSPKIELPDQIVRL